MNADRAHPGPGRRTLGPAFVCAALTALLAVLLFRAPESPRAHGDASAQMLVDLSYRPGTGGPPVDTLDGPAAPLQQPVYVGKSVWRALIWQIVANVLIAAGIVASTRRLSRARSAWALAIFAAI